MAASRTYATCAQDDAETPFEAFRDVQPILERIAELVGKPARELAIWDPFYCAGSMVGHLRRLGFDNVHNRDEDAYAVMERGEEPAFDVLCSNPPYSGDHMERIFAYCTAGQRVRHWLLLVPQYVSRKAYFLEHLRLSDPNQHPLYVGPVQQAYSFTTPSADQPLLHSPGSFQTSWFVSPFEGTAAATLHWWQTTQAHNPHAVMVAAATQLPRLAPAAFRTPAMRRWAKKKRRLAADHSDRLLRQRIS